MALQDFLKTSTPKHKLRAALDVVREFKNNAEWGEVQSCGPLDKFELYLAHLMEGRPLIFVQPPTTKKWDGD